MQRSQEYFLVQEGDVREIGAFGPFRKEALKELLKELLEQYLQPLIVIGRW